MRRSCDDARGRAVNILIAISHMRTGGAQNFVVHLARELSGRDRVFVYDCGEAGGRDPRDMSRYLPGDVTRLEFPRIFETAGLFAQRVARFFGRPIEIRRPWRMRYFRKLISRRGIDLVNTHLVHADLFAAEALRDLKIPVVVTDHGEYRHVGRSGIVRQEQIEAVFRRAGGLIFIADANQDALARCPVNPKTPCRKIYNGIRPPDPLPEAGLLRRRLGIPADALVFGMVARGIPEKGWEEALLAFHEVRRRSPDRQVYLVLGGEGEGVEAAKKKMPAEDASFIRWLGHVADPWAVTKDFDVGLLPTYYAGESLPNFLMECFFLGKPVIASAVGGIPEMIMTPRGPCGILVGPDASGRADLGALAKAMSNYAGDQKLLALHASRAVSGASRFLIRASALAYRDFFEEILER